MWYESEHSASFQWLFSYVGVIIKETFLSFFGSVAPDFFKSFLEMLLIWVAFCLFCHLARGVKKL